MKSSSASIFFRLFSISLSHKKGGTDTMCRQMPIMSLFFTWPPFFDQVSRIENPMSYWDPCPERNTRRFLTTPHTASHKGRTSKEKIAESTGHQARSEVSASMARSVSVRSKTISASIMPNPNPLLYNTPSR